ncbi:MAG: hypothetical protein AAB548_00670 [Patescibacteria group bacterium]
MSFLDKLSSIVKVDLSKLKNFKISILSGLKFQVNIVNNNTIQINPDKYPPEQQKKLQGILKEHFEKGGLIIEDLSLSRLEQFNQVDGSSQTQATLEYFKGKIPAQDLEILRYSIYLKSVFESGQSVTEIKQQLNERFGDRGRNICNLYSAGYFGTQIRPLYDSLFNQPNFSPEKFTQIYELIVTESPYAFFVSRATSREAVLLEITRKMETSRKYGIRNINIHGIGKGNEETIYFVLDKIRDKILQPPEILREGDVLVVKITFKTM